MLAPTLEALQSLMKGENGVTHFSLPFRQATQDDAKELAVFVNMAGEGLPLYLWQQMAAPAESPWEIGYARAMRETGAFSFRNAVLRLYGGEVAACLIGYPLENDPSAVDDTDIPPMFVPLHQLEALVPDCWYINVIATKKMYRGKGIGKELLVLAENIASSQGRFSLSLIVADTNTAARNFYTRYGYREFAQRPMVKEQWVHPGQNWVLMTKNLDDNAEVFDA